MRFASALAWHALQTARALNERDHEVMLFCQEGSPLAEWTKSDNFVVDRALNLNRTNPKQIVCGIRSCRKAFRDFRPDLLNPHCPPGHSFFVLARALEGSRMPIVRTVAEPRYPKNNAVNRYLHERKTAGLIYTTRSSFKRYQERFQLDHIRQGTILPGFRADEFANGVEPLDLRKQLGLDAEVIIFGIVARMSPEKGQEVLIEALTLLDDKTRARCHFVLTGDDCRERGADDLRTLAKQNGVDKYLTFQQRYQDIRPLIAGLDVGLITSVRSEAVCRIALEYMSFTKPIISSDVNILPEVVRDGENGWIFPNRNAKALAKCIQAAVEDKALRDRRGKRGYELVHQDFSMEQYSEQTVQFYNSVLSS